MAVLTVTGTPVAGIKYTVTTASSVDWPSVANSTYFLDLTDKLPHYKDAQGNVLDVINKTDVIQGACSDETTALTTGANKLTFRMPYAMTLTAVRASLTTAQTSGIIFTVDVNVNGTTVLSTKITIDNTEKTSTTAAAAVISTSFLPDDSEITIDVDQIGDGTAKGLKIALIGYRL